MTLPEVTVFVPTYNRWPLVRRAVLSALKERCVREVIVIDDGSTDGTQAGFAEDHVLSDPRIQYVWQPNAGKHVCRNRAAQLATGEYFFTLDSDDELHAGGLDVLAARLREVPAAVHASCAGIEGLCGDRSGDVLGDEFPADGIVSTHLYTRFTWGVGGDKVRLLRTSVLKEFVAPTFPGERFLAESFLWLQIGVRYFTYYVNDVVVLVDYQSDGLSSRSVVVRRSNPVGTTALYALQRSVLVGRPEVPARFAIRAGANLLRFAPLKEMGWVMRTLARGPISLVLPCLSLGLLMKGLDTLRPAGAALVRR